MDESPSLLHYRNREIYESDLTLIRSVLASRPRMGRTGLSRVLCEAWGWRQADGRPAEHACRDLLARLDERGLVKLPQRQRKPATGKRHPLLAVDLIPLSWLAVVEPVRWESLQVRPTAPEERFGVRVYMERYHYLGYKAPIGEHLFHAALLDGELVALLAWAAAAAHAPARERYIGWDEPTRRRRLHLVTNNVR
jgi:hypothetical protein